MKQHRFGLLLIPVLGVFVVILAALALSPTGSARAQASTGAQSRSQSAGSQPDVDVCGIWDSYPVTDPGPEYSTKLYTTSALASNNVWAVGLQRNISDTTQLGYAVHWNGTTWDTIPVPASRTLPQDTLNSVVAVASNNVWMVGSSDSRDDENTLIMRWNGSSVNIVPSPSVSGEFNVLHDIVAISANDIWAVGSSLTTDSIYHPLTLHWNGSAWSIVPTPNIGSSAIELRAVDAVSANDVWAVGNCYCQGSLSGQTISLHWNGTQWNIVQMPEIPDAYDTHIQGLAAVASNDIWAVGYYSDNDPHSANSKTLTMHWNGSEWQRVSSPSYYYGFAIENHVNDISVLSSNDVWAVGYSQDSSSIFPLYLHWNGTAWTLVDPGSFYNPDSLGGISMVSTYDGWSVGYAAEPAYNARAVPVIYRYTHRCVTASPTNTPTSTATPTTEPPRCTGDRFTDVCPGDYFYTPVLALNDAGIVAGYNTAPPCAAQPNIPCFKPYNSSSRGQIAKIVSLAAGFSEPVAGQTFEDVPNGSTFHDYIERMASREIIGGYPCGGASEPCVAPNNRPYFRPGNTVSRGQLSKMVARAFNFNEPVSGQTFEDVAPGTTFYDYVGRMSERNIINGYACGATNEPCVPPNNRSYFRPGSPVTRGQTSKIVYLSQTQPTATPTAQATETAAPISTSTPTGTPSVEPTTTSTATLTEMPTATP